VEASIPISVEFTDSKQHTHVYSFTVYVVPEVGSHVTINHTRYKVLDVVHNLDRETITLCTERIKEQ
jgi:hypothetical protein